MKNYIMKNKGELAARVALSMLGILFVYFFSYSTSPLYPDYYGGDSAQFLTIGKAWMQGRIPYKEMFDHKGPFIFFIDMLGFMIAGSESGVAIIQSLFIIITLNAIFNIARLRSESSYFGIIVVVISLIIYKRNYVEGNCVEEYCLPFLAVSTYFQMKFLYCKDKRHSPYVAMFYGIAFGICAMTRITNSVMVCTGVLVISVILLIQKQYADLVRNALGFILGFVLVCIPFAFYFLHHECFGDFLYGTFAYNFEYASKMLSWVKTPDSGNAVTFFKFYFSYWCIALAAIFAFSRKAHPIALFYSLAFAMETYLFLSGQLFLQYPGICLPQVALLFNELVPLDLKQSARSFAKLAVLPIIMIICAYSIRNMAESLNIYREYHAFEGTRGSYEYLLEQIPDDELASFVAYGDNRFKGLYLAYDLTPAYKYFVIQEWHASFSEFVKNDIHSVFANGDATWILTAGQTGCISDVLEERYVIHDSVDDYVLYRKNQSHTTTTSSGSS